MCRWDQIITIESLSWSKKKTAFYDLYPQYTHQDMNLRYIYADFSWIHEINPFIRYSHFRTKRWPQTSRIKIFIHLEIDISDKTRVQWCLGFLFFVLFHLNFLPFVLKWTLLSFPLVHFERFFLYYFFQLLLLLFWCFFSKNCVWWSLYFYVFKQIKL